MASTTDVGRTAPSEPLFDLRPCLRDPVFGLVSDRWKLAPVTAGLGFLGLYFGGNLLCCWLSGTALPRPGLDASFVQDRVALVLYLFLVPLATALATRFYRQVAGAFERLYTEGTVRAPVAEYNVYLRHLHARYNSLVLHLVALGLAILVLGCLTCENQFDGERAWLDLGMGVGAIYHLLLALVAWYSAILVLAKVVITARAIHRVFDWPVDIQPAHPDGCGGFRLFSDIAVTIALFSASMGTATVLVALADWLLYGVPPSPARVVVAVVLQALTPLAFFTCLYRAHRVMKVAKETMMRQVHELYQDSFRGLQAGLARGEVADQAREEVLGLESLHGVVRRLPVWPTNTEMLSQVLLSIAVPVGLIVVQIILENVVLRGK